jgi:hypothetical protein
LGIALAAAFAAIALLAAQASAVTLYHHPLLGTIGPNGSGTTAKFVHLRSVAVDQGSGDVYAYDATKESSTREVAVYRFTAAGAPDPFTAGPGAGANVIAGLVEPGTLASIGPGLLAVAPPGSPGGTAGDFYVILGGKVEVYSPQGAHLGTIDGSGNPNPGGTVARSVTVDKAGNLYISYWPGALFTAGHLDKYVPSTNPPTGSDFDSELVFEGRAVCDAVFATGVFYASTAPKDCGNSAGDVRTPYSLSFPGSGGSAPAVPEGPAMATAYNQLSLATDFSNDDLYAPGEYQLVEKERTQIYRGIDQFDAAGERVSFIEVGTVIDLDVDAASGRIYVPIHTGTGGTDQRNVRIYGDGEPIQPPTAAIDPVTDFDFDSAHLTGTVNPGGSGDLQEIEYRFECTPACPGLEEFRSVPGDGADHLVSDEAVGLTPGTDYEAILVVRSLAAGKMLEAARATASFETLPKPSAEAPEAAIDPVTVFDSESAHLTGTVDPKGTGELQAATYRFEYSTDGVKWTSAGDQGPVEGGPQAVSDDLSGLAANTTYQVRLHAENVGGGVNSGPPDPTFTTAAAPPRVEVTGATGVFSTSAQLNGRVDPRNSQTAYYFEWGPADCSSNPCASAPASEDGDAGSGGGFVWVHAPVEGLDPQQSYSYRLVARNSAGEAVSGSASFTTAAPSSGCPNEDLRVGPSASLPGCRAYEMVSPLDKNGGNVAATPRKIRVAADGNAVTFKSTSAFAGATGGPFTGVEYISLRDAAGWRTRAVSPYQQAPPSVIDLIFSGPGYTGKFASDLDTGVYLGFAPIAGATTANVAEKPNLYLASGLRSGEPSFQLLSDSETPLGAFEEGEAEISYADASDDFGKVVFESRNNLTAQATGTGQKLYESEDGELRLAGILPDSSCASPPCPAPVSVAGGGAILEYNAKIGNRTDTDHVVSADGTRVFFTVGSRAQFFSYAYRGSIYARIDGQSTVQIDASERTVPDPGGAGRSQFGAASADGSVVWFTSGESLVDADTDGEITLYRYEFDKPAGHRLTAIPVPNAPGSKFMEVTGVSRSGDFAYVRTDNEIDVVHGDRYSLVAAKPTEEPSVVWDDLLSDRTGKEMGSFRVSADGRQAVFSTNNTLTGYDSSSPNCAGGFSGYYIRCAEVYLYDYDTGKLTCVSCNFGHVPVGSAIYNVGLEAEGRANTGLTGEPDTNAAEPLSADGRFVFFSSPDPLVPRDSNGRYDVYAYDVEKGETRLISSGQCACNSFFMSADPAGDDVFFTTNERLVRADTDDQADLYDARVDGGIPWQNAAPPAECQGDACQGQPASPPSTTPGSASFSGPGSPPPSRQQRGCRHRHRHRHHKCGKRHAHHAGGHSRTGHIKQGGQK